MCSQQDSESSSTRPRVHEAAMARYRDLLVKADLKASEAYDKAVMTLSGGTLAISLTFIKDVAPSPQPGTIWSLETAWICLAISILAILFSMLTSRWAIRKAIDQVDRNDKFKGTPGGHFAYITKVLNVAAGLAFFGGVFFLGWFAITNMASPSSS